MKYKIARYLKQNSETLIIFERSKQIKELKQELNHNGHHVICYALMLATTSLEEALKGIFKTYLNYHNTHGYILNFVYCSIKRQFSFDYHNIADILGKFDLSLKDKFKNRVQNNENKEKILDHVKSLLTTRNVFAHTGKISSGTSINTIIKQYKSAVILMGILISVLNLVEE
ncbi:HEPN domain-containing protein [Helicobacter brantae]|uniref:RiboL-PSP-HEPN domain-containing protein n=1 Tax=Helicobacter brantae TaxID=375927 RepID=A0A3D8J0T1_9HELI|nr:HEPN domain-containing protein [Helicobacter brantae]RDU70816.1 hypothetical protein CQA58_04655 [Helicobacter brantae]